VELTDDERSQLLAWTRRAKSANAVAIRSRIVLAAADGLGNTAVAAKLGIEVGTARKWRARFLADRLEGLLDEPRPGRPRTVSDEQVEAVITWTLETTPADATHWSTRSLAPSWVCRSRRCRGSGARSLGAAPAGVLEAQRDPRFIDVRDVVGHYLDPRKRRSCAWMRNSSIRRGCQMVCVNGFSDRGVGSRKVENPVIVKADAVPSGSPLPEG
jgi:hypothetical protein